MLAERNHENLEFLCSMPFLHQRTEKTCNEAPFGGISSYSLGNPGSVIHDYSVPTAACQASEDTAGPDPGIEGSSGALSAVGHTT